MTDDEPRVIAARPYCHAHAPGTGEGSACRLRHSCTLYAPHPDLRHTCKCGAEW